MSPMVLLLVAAAVLLALPEGAAAFPIADSGRARCAILLDEEARPAERRAARELAEHLRQMTGATFSVTTNPGAARNALVVGPCAVARQALGEDTLAALAPEQFLIRTQGRHLFLVGGSPRGTLYAAYHLLDNVLGVRWWTPTYTEVPRKRTLEVRRLNLNVQPTFEYRDPYLATAWHADWAARNRCNGMVGNGGPNGPADEEHGGGFLIYAGGSCHTFDQFVPAALLEQHPTWFSEVEGKRVAGQYEGQLCLSNPEVLEYLIDAVDQTLQKTPGATNVSITQNDNVQYCRCARCAAIDAEEGSPAGAMLRFVNAVAERLEAKYPRVMFDTFAYQYTRKAPRLARPRRNVIVRLCSIECDFGRPLSAATNRAFAEDAKAWAAIAPRLYVWDYITNFTNYFKPHPNLRVLGPNLRFFAEHNVRGVFEQGTEITPTGEFEDLRAWVLSRLLWNPYQDDQKLIAEFCDGCYGPASKPIQAYIKLIHDLQEGSDYYLSCFAQDPAPFLNAEAMARADQLFKQALAAVAGKEPYEAHVRRAYLPVQSQWLTHYEEWAKEVAAKGLPAPDPAPKILREFKQLATALGIRLYTSSKPTTEMIAEWEQRYGAAQ